jgi:NAD(P)-dependent dehydrogenase (short-subunit alcohol dehydrogenase family)
MDYHSLDLKGRTAVVVGGTSGIDEAIATGLAHAGADVVASGRRREQVAATAAAIEAVSRRSLSVTVDVADRVSLERLLSSVMGAFGNVDILINSAALISRGSTIESQESEWQKLLDTNLTGVLRACQIFGRHMLQSGYGRIVNITSRNAFVALDEVAAYAAPQSSSSIVDEIISHRVGAGSGVCVNAIAPGVFPTALNSKPL